MNRLLILAACLGAAANLVGCAQAHKPRASSAASRAAAAPAATGFAAVTGFRRDDPLPVPPQGLSLAEAVVRAGRPEALGGPYEQALVVWRHEGVRYAVSLPLIQGTPVGLAAVRDGDTLALVGREAAIDGGYILRARPPENLLTRILAENRPFTDATAAVFLRVVDGEPTYFVFPNLQDQILASPLEQMRVAASLVPVPAATPVAFLEPDELPFALVGPPAPTPGVPAATNRRLRALCREDGPVQFPRLAGNLPRPGRPR